MPDPVLWTVFTREGFLMFSSINEFEASANADAGPGRRVVKYVPEAQQPPLALCSGEPCTVMTTSYYETLKADAEKWLAVEKLVKGGGS